jgi:hypothetical protein
MMVSIDQEACEERFESHDNYQKRKLAAFISEENYQPSNKLQNKDFQCILCLELRD